MYRKPVVQLMGPSNKDVLPALGQMFQSISWEDGAGKKTDKATLTLLGPPSQETLPARDAQYTLLAGWSDVGGSPGVFPRALKNSRNCCFEKGS